MTSCELNIANGCLEHNRNSKDSCEGKKHESIITPDVNDVHCDGNSLQDCASVIGSKTGIAVANGSQPASLLTGSDARHSNASEVKSTDFRDLVTKDPSDKRNLLCNDCCHDEHHRAVQCIGERDLGMPETLLESLSLSEGQRDNAIENFQPKHSIVYTVYESELQMPDIMRLITKDLSEPYSIYTYRYFINNWPNLCFLAMHEEEKTCIGAIVCKVDTHKNCRHRGYIAMLAVNKDYRRDGIGSNLVYRAIKAMQLENCDEVFLETEITNHGALRLYEKLGFVRDKRLFRYYLNGVDALRLKLWLK